MLKLTIMLFLTLTLSTVMCILYQLINKKMIMERNKMTPFECGFDPKSSSRLPFSTQFFLIGILFLIFDVELVMIMPMIITLKKSNMIMWYMTSVSIIMILIVGLYYEWKNGVIEWIN
uniref:NADH-ubiquinone oxidoreductase chain 3 n=1 Tax=Trachypeplus jacobsoni TaxID=2172479 RepID=A0A343WNR8_9HEMI|nr:NADH dehydrogenase subunit 3 [Trachypeplus jacobsoni]AWD31644.1 NADH dehydrogenase subunit 3 [Trachypeplus jacobsoni]